LLVLFEEMSTMPATMETARETGSLGEKPLMVVSAADEGVGTGAL
jgi:hypothetical protein